MSCIPLIHFLHDGTGRVNEDAMDILVRMSRNVAVICIAGPYRTGKSFLVNSIINDKDPTRGFQVGPTVQPCTKGLWLYTSPIHSGVDDNGQPYDVLVIDTEGTGATNSDNNRDTRLFALALLISSYFMYNSQGAIDEPALSNLQVVTNVSRMVKVAAADVNPFAAAFDDNTIFSASDIPKLGDEFPRFMWVVRDFSLQLTSRTGESITSDEYLEESLSDDLKKQDDGGVRQSIKGAFPSRGCVTLVRPCNNEDNLQHLGSMDESIMRPEFINQVKSLRNRVLNETAPKTIYGHNVTGAMLAQLCRFYTQAMNEGGVPVIEDAWKSICEAQARRAHDHAMKVWDDQIGESENSKHPPKPPFSIMENIRAAHDEAIRVFSGYQLSDERTTDNERAALVKMLDTKGVAHAHAAIDEWDNMLFSHKNTEFDEGHANGRQLINSFIPEDSCTETEWGRICMEKHQSDLVANLQYRHDGGISSKRYKQTLADLKSEQDECVKLQDAINEHKQTHADEKKRHEEELATAREEIGRLKTEMDANLLLLSEQDLKRSAAEEDILHLRQEVDLSKEREAVALEKAKCAQELELELASSHVELRSVRENLLQTQEYTEELKKSNQRRIDDLNVKWTEHADQLNATNKGLHDDYGGQLEECKKVGTEISKKLKLTEKSLQQSKELYQKHVEEANKSKIEMMEKYAQSEKKLREEIAQLTKINKDMESEKIVLKETLADKELQLQDTLRQQMNDRQMNEMKARETAHRLSSRCDELSKKRKRCEELESQIAEDQKNLSKLKWLEDQNKKLEPRIVSLTQENELIRKDMQRVKEENMHMLTQQSIELKTKESLCDGLRSKCEVLTSRVAQLQSQVSVVQ